MLFVELRSLNIFRNQDNALIDRFNTRASQAANPIMAGRRA